VEGGGPQVTEQDIANIVAQWTGIPIEKVSSDETERLIKVGRGAARRGAHGCANAVWTRAGACPRRGGSPVGNVTRGTRPSAHSSPHLDPNPSV
jgi:hypothetical protein